MATLNHYVAKSVKNKNDSAEFTWWRTPFNMPIPNLFTNTPTWTEYEGPIYYYQWGTSFDLSSFLPGMEIVAAFGNFHFDGPISGTENMSLYWLDPDYNTLGENNVTINLNVAAGNWYEYLLGQNIGCCSWEVWENATYMVESYCDGADSEILFTDIAFSNVPSVSKLPSTKQGYIWVEGSNLRFCNAGGGSQGGEGAWNHVISAASGGAGNVGAGNAGKIWIDTNNDLHWIDSSGNDYKALWKKKQFASTWTNSATNQVYAGTGNAGKIWVDNEFGQTHLAYIGYDGYKYLTGAGDNPYTSTP